MAQKKLHVRRKKNLTSAGYVHTAEFVHFACKHTIPILYMKYLFQVALQAEKDKLHSMEKVIRQKEKELEQCKVRLQ